MTARKLTIALAALSLGGALWWQHRRVIGASEWIRADADHLEQWVQNLEKTAPRLAELRGEIEELDGVLEMQLRVLPQTVDIQGFVEGFTAWAEGFSVSVEDYRSRLGTNSVGCYACQSAEISFKLRGERLAIEALFNGRDTLERLAQWLSVDAAEDWTDIDLRVFAREYIESTKENLCAPEERPERPSYLWPFSSVIDDELLRFDGLCEIYDGLALVDDEVNEYVRRLEKRDYWTRILKELSEHVQENEITKHALPPGAISSHDRDPPPITLGEETSVVTEPLLPSGAPDYALALNRELGVDIDPALNAAALLVPTLWEPSITMPNRLGLDEEDIAAAPVFFDRNDDDAAADEEFQRHLARASEGPWSEEDFPEIASWLRDNEDALARIQSASRRPIYWLPLREGENLFEAPISGLVRVRQVGRALQARAFLKLDAGDADAAAEDVLTLQRLGALLGQRSFVLGALVGSLLRQQASEVVPMLATSPALTPERGRRLAAELSAPPSPWSVSDLRTMDRYLLLAGVFSLYDRGARHGAGGWMGLFEYLGSRTPMSDAYRIDVYAVDWNEALMTVNRSVDTAFDAAPRPDADWRSGAGSWTHEASSFFLADDFAERAELALEDADTRRELTLALLATTELYPTARRAQIVLNEQAAQKALVIAALNLAAHEKESGGWPDGTDASLPDAEAPGYAFQYHPFFNGSDSTLASSYAYTATPTHHGFTGFRSLCVDSAGTNVTIYEDVPIEVDGRCVEPPD